MIQRKLLLLTIVAFLLLFSLTSLANASSIYTFQDTITSANLGGQSGYVDSTHYIWVELANKSGIVYNGYISIVFDMNTKIADVHIKNITKIYLDVGRVLNDYGINVYYAMSFAEKITFNFNLTGVSSLEVKVKNIPAPVRVAVDGNVTSQYTYDGDLTLAISGTTVELYFTTLVDQIVTGVFPVVILILTVGIVIKQIKKMVK